MTNQNSKQLHDALVDTIKVANQEWWVLAKLLHSLKLGEEYKNAVGHGIDTWNAYISQPEIDLTKTQADRLVKMYDKFSIDLGLTDEQLANIPIRNLELLFKSELDDEHIQSHLDDAQNLSNKDLKELLHDHKSNFDGVRTYTYVVMRKCNETGSLSKVHEVESDSIKEAFSLNE